VQIGQMQINWGFYFLPHLPYIALRYKAKGRGFDYRWCHWNFSFTLSFQQQYGPAFDSAFNRNEYHEFFLGVKAAGA
jgi:hypothetical protein